MRGNCRVCWSATPFMFSYLTCCLYEMIDDVEQKKTSYFSQCQIFLRQDFYIRYTKFWGSFSWLLVSATFKLRKGRDKHKNPACWSLTGGQDVDARPSSVTENLHAPCCDSPQCSFNLVDKAPRRKLCQICPARHCFSSKAGKWRITLFHWTIPNRHKQGQTEQQRV